MVSILAELDTPDREHPDTWLTHESGWTISISESGLAILENLDIDGGPRYREGVTHDEALRLWLLLALGNIDEVVRQDWNDGQGPPISAEEMQRRQHEAANLTLKLYRDFYDTLGPEDAGKPCRRQGCTRGSVEFSVLCRPHHFESIYKQHCPFDH